MSAPEDIFYIQRALALAKKGAGFVSPNPLVGCVIVKGGKVIAEGYHKKFGGSHAERAALAKLQTLDSKFQIRGATVYINLEPCSHFGKTPPCADALIAAGVKRVVVGMKDPNPLVAGKGIRKLRAAGVEVTVGLLEQECRELNEAFVQWITTKRPFVLLKCAMTLDGALTLKKGERSSLSSVESLHRVHELRQEYDAIGLGVGSVVIDDPRLTTRKPGKTRNPVRVIFDSTLRISETARLLEEDGRTIIFVGKGVNGAKKKRLLGRYAGLEIVIVPLGQNGQVALRSVLTELSQRNIASIMVEGGAEVARAFLAARLVDKFIIIYTPHLAEDTTAPRLFAPTFPEIRFAKKRWEMVGDDAWFVGWPKKG